MKYKIMIVIGILVLVILLFLLFNYLKKRSVIISGVKYFNYSYTVGYHYEASVVYKFELNNNEYSVIIKDEGKGLEDASQYDVDKDFAKKLENILNKYKINSWDGFQKSNKNVLDGNSFDLYIKFNNKSISASGYMKWPRDYDLFKSDINELFSELRN